MARDDETSALELHIKVNGQNLSAISEKHNIGTLRPPSDPSWPKIPLRRLNDNTDDIIEPPCVVTLIGTPRKGRSIVRAATCQHSRSKLNQKYEAPTHIPKRLPGSIDPRFKRQVSRQKAEKPDESCDTKNDKQTVGTNTSVLQEIKKPDKLLETVTKNGTTECPFKEQLISEAEHSSQCDTNNERRDIEDRSPQIQKQETGGPLLLMVDEKKIHALPINALNIGTAASSDTQPLQCYSVQIPVVAYHNMPLQMSNMPRQMQEDIKIHGVRDRESAENIYDPASTLIPNSIHHGPKESENKKCPINGIREHDGKNGNDNPGNKSISRCEIPDTWKHNKENVKLSVSLNQDTVNEILSNNSPPEKFNTTDNVNNTKDDEAFLDVTAGKLKTVAGQIICNVDNSCMANRCGIERKTLSETRIAKTSLQEQKLVYPEEDSRVSLNEPPTNKMNNKMLKKDVDWNEQIKDEELNDESKEKHEDPRVKRKTAPLNLSRKAKSFFRKKSRLAITDSDCTLILPGFHIKGKQCERTRLKVSQLLHRKIGINITKSTARTKPNNAKASRQINSCSLTNLRAKGDLFAEPSSIPLRTQELLNQSYWEYYWRLKRKLALPNKPDNAGERDKSRECLPESQTLQQCSVLSCMINTALRDSTAVDGRSSSDPVVATFNAHENTRHEASSSGVLAKKTKRRKTKRVSKRLLGLRIIALLGIVAIIFLPMMYDYFFDVEYKNDYEDANYIELALQYVVSSFGEAFDGIFDVLNTILLRPVRLARAC